MMNEAQKSWQMEMVSTYAKFTGTMTAIKKTGVGKEALAIMKEISDDYGCPFVAAVYETTKEYLTEDSTNEL